MIGRNSAPHSVLAPVAALVLALFVLLPLVFLTPGRDSSVYLYVAQGILAGEVPYRDAWDHKTPLIYFIDALGLGLTGGRLWGVWLLEVLSLGLSAWLSFALLRPRHGNAIAAGVTVLWVLTLSNLLERGNFTEEFTLPLQFGALYLATRRQGPGRWLFWIGLMAAFAFLLRPNHLATFAAIAGSVLLQMPRRRLLSSTGSVLGWGGLGALAILLPTIGYFALNGAVAAMWDCAFEYSMSYSAVDLDARLKAIGAGIDQMHWSYGGLLVWLIIALRRATGRARPTCTREFLLDAALLGLPLEFFLSTFSGRSYPHYYILWLPLTAVAIAELFGFLLTRSGHARRLAMTFACGLAVLAFADLDYRDLVRHYRLMRDPAADAHVRRGVQWLEEHTGPEDTVLIYGVDVSTLVLTGRRAPSRFFTFTPLFTTGYATPTMVKEFMAGLSARPPSAIIDTSSDVLMPLDTAERVGWSVPENVIRRNYGSPPAPMDQFYEFVDERYERVDSAEDWWFLYLPLRR